MIRRSIVKLTSNALLLKKVPRGDADLICTFFSDAYGTFSTIAYAARRSKRRFAVLEAFHTLRLEADDVADRDLAVLQSAALVEPRTGFLSDLGRMQAAATALGWLRRTCPPRAPEPELWKAALAFLDACKDATPNECERLLASFGITVLTVAGLGIPLEGAPAPQRVIWYVEQLIKEHSGPNSA